MTNVRPRPSRPARINPSQSSPGSATRSRSLIGTERELEDEEQQEREEQQRIQAFLGTALGEQILPEDGQRTARVRHHALASWASVRLS